MDLVIAPIEIGLEVSRDPRIAIGIPIHNHLLGHLDRRDDSHHIHLLRGIHPSYILAGEGAIVLVDHDQLSLLDHLGIVEGCVEEGVDDRDEKEEEQHACIPLDRIDLRLPDRLGIGMEEGESPPPLIIGHKTLLRAHA